MVERSLPEPPDRERRYDAEICELFRAEAGRLTGFLINAGTPWALVDDIVQDSFLATRSQWHHVRRYDSPRGYLYKVAFRLMGRRMKERYARAEPFADPYELVRSGEGDPELDRADWRIALTEAMRKLSRRQRETVLLHYYGGFPVADISNILGIAKGSVKRCLSDARQALKELLGDAFGGEEEP